jgi:hypothetical protein
MAPGIEAFQISRILQGIGAALFQRIERGV